MTARKSKAAKAQGASQQPTVSRRPPNPAKATWAKDAKTVITADTKVTICPGYKPRFEAIPLPGGLSVQKGRVSAVEDAHARAHLSDAQEQGA